MYRSFARHQSCTWHIEGMFFHTPDMIDLPAGCTSNLWARLGLSQSQADALYFQAFHCNQDDTFLILIQGRPKGILCPDVSLACC